MNERRLRSGGAAPTGSPEDAFPLEGEGVAQRSLGVGVNSAQRSLGVGVNYRIFMPRIIFCMPPPFDIIFIIFCICSNWLSSRFTS